jgi:hypothetical protein
LNHRERVRVEQRGVIDWFGDNHVTSMLRLGVAARIPRSGRSHAPAAPDSGPVGGVGPPDVPRHQWRHESHHAAQGDE